MYNFWRAGQFSLEFSPTITPNIERSEWFEHLYLHLQQLSADLAFCFVKIRFLIVEEKFHNILCNQKLLDAHQIVNFAIL